MKVENNMVDTKIKNDLITDRLKFRKKASLDKALFFEDTKEVVSVNLKSISIIRPILLKFKEIINKSLWKTLKSGLVKLKERYGSILLLVTLRYNTYDLDLIRSKYLNLFFSERIQKSSITFAGNVSKVRIN